MATLYSLRTFVVVVGLFGALLSHSASAGGIMLGGTRIIYPATAKQVTLPVRNTSGDASFLVQSWVEDSSGKKSTDFVVTPPMYVSGPHNENSLRLIYTGESPVKDRETLYYFNSKAIPSLDKKKIDNENILLLAAITRIKLFIRPAGLKISVNDAVSKVTFHQHNNGVRIENPTPYYMTLAKIKSGKKTLPDLMVSPFSSQSVEVSVQKGHEISYRVLNDFGALTPQINTIVN